MKKQKFISVILAVVFIFSLTATTATAYIGISPFYLYTDTVTNTLSITGTTATCKSVISGFSNVTKIEATQYLQRWNGSSWANVSSASWNGSANSSRLSMTNTKSSLGSGTYRVYVSAKVYVGSNSETVTGYSNSVTV